MTTFPPASPSLSGDNLTASRFLKTPPLVAKRLGTLIEQRFVGDMLLQGRQGTDSGAVTYEQVEGIYAQANPEVVAPGSEYTMTQVTDGPAGLARVVKSGIDVPITDESINRRQMSPVDKALMKLANTVGRAADLSIVSLVASSVTSTRAASAAWSASSAVILRDILRAVADIRSQNLGYEPNVLLVDDQTWAYMASDSVVSAAMAREDKTNPIYSGRFNVLAGLEVVPTSTANMPGASGSNAWVLDTTQLGFIATENLEGGYQQATELVQSKVIRDDNKDGWKVRARSNFVPVVTDPLAGFKISGVA